MTNDSTLLLCQWLWREIQKPVHCSMVQFPKEKDVNPLKSANHDNTTKIDDLDRPLRLVFIILYTLVILLLYIPMPLPECCGIKNIQTQRTPLFSPLETLSVPINPHVTKTMLRITRLTTADPSHSQFVLRLISSEMIPATPQRKSCRYYLVYSFVLFFVLSWLVVLPMTFALSWSRYVIFIFLRSQTCVMFFNAGQDKDVFGLSNLYQPH